MVLSIILFSVEAIILEMVEANIRKHFLPGWAIWASLAITVACVITSIVLIVYNARMMRANPSTRSPYVTGLVFSIVTTVIGIIFLIVALVVFLILLYCL